MKLLRSTDDLHGQERSWMYNGYDVCVTLDVYNELSAQLAAAPQNIQDAYKHSLNMLAPAIEMGYRGFRIDPLTRAKEIKKLNLELLQLQSNFDALCEGCFGKTINTKSYKQIKEMYDYLGVRAAKTDEAALARLATNHIYARPFCRFILAIRDRKHQLNSLQVTLHNQRMFYKINVGGTKTRRFSCRADDLGRGDNQQNVDKRHRNAYIPDKGKTLVNIDLEQADSRNLGAHCLLWLDSPTYLDACESNDLHTYVASLAWPNIKTREQAEKLFYRQHSFRDAAKRLGHARNFYGSIPEISNRTQVPRQRVDAFVNKYEKEFPAIVELREEVRRRLRLDRSLTNLWGITRFFHDRLEDNKIIKDALGYLGQSNTGYEIDHAIQVCWREFPQCELILQVHDSLMFQIDDVLVDEILEEMMPKLELHREIKGRDFFVPLEAEYGKNWGKYDEDTNPEGLRKWTS